MSRNLRFDNNVLAVFWKGDIVSNQEPEIINKAHQIKAKLQRMRPDQRRKALVSLRRTDPLMARVVAIVTGNGQKRSI